MNTFNKISIVVLSEDSKNIFFKVNDLIAMDYVCCLINQYNIDITMCNNIVALGVTDYYNIFISALTTRGYYLDRVDSVPTKFP